VEESLSRPNFGIPKGLLVTLKNLIRHPVTVQYPDERLVISRRARGTDIIWNKDTCIACRACERACPTKAISIDVSRGEDKKLKVDRFQIDFGVCIACGLCVESCPVEDALYMSYSYERAVYRREDLISSGDELLPGEGKQPSGYAHPEVEKTLTLQTLLLDKDREDSQ
jgi:NAD(P)H-quinone oxidoreductase subunit I